LVTLQESAAVGRAMPKSIRFLRQLLVVFMLCSPPLETAKCAMSASRGDRGLTDSLESRHQGGAFVQGGQNRVPGLWRKHQDHPINAGVTVAF
jgi:hypothetical protein